jgi:hypothetical protein
MQILVLSNGHGEDAIAVRIIEQLQQHRQAPSIKALPLVGMGHAYTQLNIAIAGSVRQMPSGGFVYQDGRQLWRDLQGGLLQLTRSQYQVIRQWGKSGGKILAVGDIVPLLFAWSSGADYAFVGTARSEYYIRDEDRWLPQTSELERWLGSVYLPWERWLMSRPRCKAVFPRDTLTAKILQQWSIPVFDLGNPMMDEIDLERQAEQKRFVPTQPLPHPSILSNSEELKRGDFTASKSLKTQSNNLIFRDRPLIVLLLPGSRMPEALQNWQKLVTATTELIATFTQENFSTRYFAKGERQSLVFIAAIAPGLALEAFQNHAIDSGWHPLSPNAIARFLDDPQALAFRRDRTTLVLSQNAYAKCLRQADIAIAMTGTATEQFVGLGKPVVAIAGEGPQFTYKFAEAQTRLLGCSVTLVEQPQEVPTAIKSLLQQPDRWQAIDLNGRRRMGTDGAAKRIADCLLEKLR